jgi:hypothetical protein
VHTQSALSYCLSTTPPGTNQRVRLGHVGDAQQIVRSLYPTLTASVDHGQQSAATPSAAVVVMTYAKERIKQAAADIQPASSAAVHAPWPHHACTVAPSCLSQACQVKAALTGCGILSCTPLHHPCAHGCSSHVPQNRELSGGACGKPMTCKPNMRDSVPITHPGSAIRSSNSQDIPRSAYIMIPMCEAQIMQSAPGHCVDATQAIRHISITV